MQYNNPACRQLNHQVPSFFQQVARVREALHRKMFQKPKSVDDHRTASHRFSLTRFSELRILIPTITFGGKGSAFQRASQRIWAAIPFHKPTVPPEKKVYIGTIWPNGRLSRILSIFVCLFSMLFKFSLFLYNICTWQPHYGQADYG